jgi:hypothetical protein
VQRSANHRWLSVGRPAGLVPSKSCVLGRFNSIAAPPPGQSSTRSGAPGSSVPSAFMRAMMRATNERSALVRAGIHSFGIGSATSGSAFSRQAISVLQGALTYLQAHGVNSQSDTVSAGSGCL